MRIAIIGTGIAGLGAAHRLHPRTDLTIYEAADWVGGHTHTVDVGFPGQSVPVDTGFIVYNDVTYPRLRQLFADLGVATEPSDMSFAAMGGPVEYEGSASGLFADPRSLADRRHWRMIADILRFNRRVNSIEPQEVPAAVTVGQFTAGLGDSFRERYLLPMCAAIWSTPETDMAEYPARTLVQFFKNHGLVRLANRPQWRTVTGGARSYVELLTRPFADRIRLETPVREIRREPHAIEVVTDGSIERFDGVVMATHADTTLKILNGAATREETDVLGTFRYSRNDAVLHCDAGFMPEQRRAWASWNVVAGTDGEPPSVTYWMNRLQNLRTPKPVFVTLNPSREPQDIRGRWVYDHPMFDRAAIAAQARLPDLQGRDRIWFAGAYFRYGFHEDGLMAGYQAADSILSQRAIITA